MNASRYLSKCFLRWYKVTNIINSSVHHEAKSKSHFRGLLLRTKVLSSFRIQTKGRAKVYFLSAPMLKSAVSRCSFLTSFPSGKLTCHLAARQSRPSISIIIGYQCAPHTLGSGHWISTEQICGLFWVKFKFVETSKWPRASGGLFLGCHGYMVPSESWPHPAFPNLPSLYLAMHLLLLGLCLPCCSHLGMHNLADCIPQTQILFLQQVPLSFRAVWQCLLLLVCRECARALGPLHPCCECQFLSFQGSSLYPSDGLQHGVSVQVCSFCLFFFWFKVALLPHLNIP